MKEMVKDFVKKRNSDVGDKRISDLGYTDHPSKEGSLVNSDLKTNLVSGDSNFLQVAVAENRDSRSSSITSVSVAEFKTMIKKEEE